MKNITKDLTAIASQLNTLAKKVEKMAGLFAPSPKASAPVKQKKRVAKKKAAPKSKPQTPTDQVLTIMKRFKKGITVGLLREKSGLSEKQISNIVHRACKKGRIKRIERGVYSVYGL